MNDVGKTSQKAMKTEQPSYYHMHVGSITFYLSLTLCGQLGSSNQSALFILSYSTSRTCYLHFIIDPSFFMYDSFNLFL